MRRIFAAAVASFVLLGFSPSYANELPPTEYFLTLNNGMSGDIREDLERIKYLSQFNYLETHEYLINRLYFEVNKQKQDGDRTYHPDIYLQILKFFAKHGTREILEHIINVKRLSHEAFSQKSFYPQLQKWFENTGNMIAHNRDRQLPPKALDLVQARLKQQNKIQNPEADEEEEEDDLQSETGTTIEIKNLEEVSSILNRIKGHLETNLIGQPEVVESLVALERTKLIFGQELPAVRMLMGLPGNGKDTTAETYTDAIHGYKGAYEKHMFRLPVLRSEADLWKVLGSATGYIGSDNFPPFLRFLVEHSGGRYILEEKDGSRGKKEYSVSENPAWLSNNRKNLPGTIPPENAVVFINEFHNWSKDIKDLLVKQALEKGIFQINNPNGGLAQIVVPVTFIVATNEGINLLASRELNGQRHGDPLPYEKLLENWERTYLDKSSLRQQLLATNGGVNSRNGRESVGISEELANRFLDAQLLLLRPLSPESLQRIVLLFLEQLSKRLKGAERLLGPMEIEWTPELTAFLQNYHYMAEDNARPMLDRVRTLVEVPLLKAIESNQIEASQSGQKLKISVNTLADGTSELSIDRSAEGKSQNIRVPILATEVDRERPVISDQRIEEIVKSGEEMKQKVFGVEHIIDRLTADTLISEEFRNMDVTADKASQPARSYMFLGMSSNGKTETAKRLAEARYGKKNSLKILDFSQVRSVDDLKQKVLGSRDIVSGNPIPSDFMKEYDRTNGQMVMVLDEIANAPRDVLKALYDVLREPVVTTFSDGRPRAMSGLTIIMTGNAGEEWFNQVPTDIPESQQLAAMLTIYDQVIKDRHARRAMLERYFSAAMLNRIGEPNIFIFGPMSFSTIRRLTQFKLTEAIERLAGQSGQRGWKVGFVSQQDYLDLVEGIENAGFVLREQGASIDRFVKQYFEDRLRTLLLKSQIPNGSSVAIRVIEKGDQLQSQGNSENDTMIRVLKVELTIQGRAEPLMLEIRGKEDMRDFKRPEVDQYLTALHEAGHELARSIFFGDKTEPLHISIIPGVTKMGEDWVYYAGIAAAQYKEDFRTTRQVVIRHIAGLAAGYIAQTLVTKGERHDEGKHNDMMRATRLAMDAVLKYGLSERFGSRSAPKGLSSEQFLGTLSGEDQQIFTEEYKALLAEGVALAEHALLANFNNALIPMGLKLAEEGHLDREQLKRFYETHPVYGENSPEMRQSYDKSKVTGAPSKTKASQAWLQSAVDKIKSWMGTKEQPTASEVAKEALKTSRDAELLDHIPRPKQIADIEGLTQKKKLDEVKGIPLPQELPIIGASSRKSEPKLTQASRCEDLFRAKAKN